MRSNLRRGAFIGALVAAAWLECPIGTALGDTPGFSKIVAGAAHKCGLTDAGGVKCWGYNYYGQLGDGTTVQRSAPVDVQGLAGGVSAIAAGIFHTCALTPRGAVKCWGYNSDGELGDGTTIQRLAPVEVDDLANGAVDIAASELHTCARIAAGSVKCWGHDSAKWELAPLHRD